MQLHAAQQKKTVRFATPLQTVFAEKEEKVEAPTFFNDNFIIEENQLFICLHCKEEFPEFGHYLRHGKKHKKMKATLADFLVYRQQIEK